MTDYRYEGHGFVVPPPLEDRDDTTELPVVRATTPHQVTETAEATAAAALVADLGDRLAGIRRLIGSRGDTAARDALHEEIVRLVADAQQLDAHLAETDRAEHDAATAEAFTDWATAPGGESR